MNGGEIPATASLICWIGISLMILYSVLELCSGLSYVKRAKRVTKSIRKQLIKNTI